MSGPRIAVALFGPQGRGSFNESGWAGVQRARATGLAVDAHWIEPLEAEARAAELRRICEQGLDLLVAHGGQGDAPVSMLSADFPDTRFAITQGGFVSANTAAYEVLQEQSAFLAGVFAGLSSRAGVVGHLSGEKVRPGLKGRAAFADGVRASGRECRFVTLFCGQQHDTELAYRAGCALHGEGVDIVFAMIDGGRDGLSRACRELSMRQIGNVIDWVARDPAVFIASAWADSGRCISDAIADFTQERFRPGTRSVRGLSSPEHVRLIIEEASARAHAGALSAWTARLLSGEYEPSLVYEGPELACP